jgi:uncharacterized protein
MCDSLLDHCLTCWARLNRAQVWDAAMRTSAAPTYFPVYRGYTDGGLVANNPSIVAVTKAMAHYPNVNPKNVAVLSLGMSNVW